MCWTILLLAICFYYIWKIIRGLPRVEGLHKKCVFITGCDSGFGNALARRLDVLGVPVFAGCLTEIGANELKEKSSERLQTLLVDVTSHDSITQAYEFVKHNIPDGTELWGIVNNAGIMGYSGPLEYMTRKAFYDVYDVNLIGVMDVTQTFLPLLKKSEGRVVNTASIAAMMTMPGSYPYMTAKHAVRAFSGGLRQEKKPYGIKVSCIMPAMFKTGILDETTIRQKISEQWESLPQEVKAEFGEKYRDTRLEQDLEYIKGAKADVTPVINDYEHALFALRPRDEYFPGMDAVIFSYMAMLPPSVLDFILEKTVMRVVKQTLPKYLEDKATKT